MPKILSRFDSGTVVDAFSGAGVYTDGKPGSSVVVAKAFLDHQRRSTWRGHLQLACLDARPDRVARLQQELGSLEKPPGFQWRVGRPGRLSERAEALQRFAHPDRQARPTLWLLDPYGPGDVSFSVVRSLLESGRGDEVILSFFAREMHQRCQVREWQKAMDVHFGGDEWRVVLNFPDQAQGMQALLAAYSAKWKALGVHVGDFAVQIASDKIRYYLIFLTRHPSGMECWTKMAQRMDPYMSRGASPQSAEQETLFGEPSTGHMREILAQLAGREVSWEELDHLAITNQHSPKVLRLALDEMLAEGLAFRQFPLDADPKARTAWPDGCRVRFYSKSDLAAGDATLPSGLPILG
ncbi:three-Cys-motif partner protein TcmP [Kineosporia babensis]|uniref:Three-Cys-motif partner protein TcmP n=2 Tax=Kineosporia babensis TaxID=499548 RepID=A0A9X1SY28_9ACTN|nr:three-Cys-motif partner protein TcmP [Kineosporia babensis]